MSAHACRIDTSKETGSLVVCTCSFVLGPFQNKATALALADEHRRLHAEPSPVTPEARARYAAAQRERRAAVSGRSQTPRAQ